MSKLLATMAGLAFGCSVAMLFFCAAAFLQDNGHEGIADIVGYSGLLVGAVSAVAVAFNVHRYARDMF